MIDEIDILEWLRISIEKDFPSDIVWVTGMLGELVEDSNNKYVSFYGKKFMVTDLEKDYIIKGKTNDKPLLDPTEKITLPKGFLPNIKEDTETTVGRLLANYILINKCLNSKLEYINKQFTIGDIEKEIGIKLVDGNESKDGITIKEYESFVDGANYIQGWSELLVIATTEKSILPPPGIDEYKKKVIKELKEKYGENALEDFAVIGELDNRLKEYDKEYLKDDPSLGITLSGKVLNNARKKMYLSFGADVGFDPNAKPVYVENSLQEGYPDDPKELTAIFNATRIASYARGAETQKGGEAAKIILRATNSFRIEGKDCGTKVGKKITITDNIIKTLLGRYYIENGEIKHFKTIEDIKNKLGKEVELRSVQYCKKPYDRYCSICAGDNLAKKENGVGLEVLSISNTILTASLKMMHNSTINLQELDLDEALS